MQITSTTGLPVEVITPTVSSEYPSLSLGGSSIVSKCKEWADAKPESVPSICNLFLNSDNARIHELLDKYHTEYSFNPVKEERSVWDSFNTGRSISIAGILGGILFILIIIAVFICIKQRKRIQSQEDFLRGEFLPYELVELEQRTSRQLLAELRRGRAVCDKPPDYRQVLHTKQEEDRELPSYCQAVGAGQQAGAPAWESGSECDSERNKSSSEEYIRQDTQETYSSDEEPPPKYDLGNTR